MKSGATLFPLTPAHLAGLGAAQISVLLYLLSAHLCVAALPLLLFVALLIAAPFFPAWRLFGPYITRGDRASKAVAVTFDDGPDPATTGPLLDLLRERGVKVCFFQVGRKVAQHPELARRVLSEGHEVGNHSFSHDVMLMLRSRSRLADEVRRGQQAFEPLGVRPLCFRPPVGIVNPRLWPELLRQGLVAVGFSRRAMDWGNRKVAGMAGRLLRAARGGEILLLHDGASGEGFDQEQWLAEVAAVLDGLEQRGLTAVPLSRLLGRPVMEPVRDLGTGVGPGPAAAFYDGLAAAYDDEQAAPSAAAVRGAEREAVEARLEALLGNVDQALEVGAGTGRFTIALARGAREVTALDVSSGMLARLEARAQQAGLDNITPVLGAAEDAPLQGTFQLVCSFSALEYVPRLEPALRRMAAMLEPGGHLYFTTAHRGPLRFFIQIGNAMRQGLWLHARSRGEVRRALRAQGLEVLAVETHGLKLPLLGGMLLEVVARKPAR